MKVTQYGDTVCFGAEGIVEVLGDVILVKMSDDYNHIGLREYMSIDEFMCLATKVFLSIANADGADVMSRTCAEYAMGCINHIKSSSGDV